MLVVTAETLKDYKIVKTIGLVMAVQEFQVARPRKAVYQALAQIIKQAEDNGANAIIGLKINSLNKTDVVAAVVVYGTAVFAQKHD